MHIFYRLKNIIKIRNLKKFLLKNNIILKKGLSNKDFDKIKKIYNLTFPTDLKMIYENYLPVSTNFYDWSDFSVDNVNYIKEIINRPLDGILFDIEFNKFWMECFGEKTKDLKYNLKIAQKYYENNVYKPIPIYSHRYIPSYPSTENNPIFSIVQTDIIFYGNNIFNYFYIEFSKPQSKLHQKMLKQQKKYTPFWSDIVT